MCSLESRVGSQEDGICAGVAKVFGAAAPQVALPSLQPFEERALKGFELTDSTSAANKKLRTAYEGNKAFLQPHTGYGESYSPCIAASTY